MRVSLTPNRPGVSELVRKVEEKCIAANLGVPHRRTIVARVKRSISRSVRSDAVNPGSQRAQRRFPGRSVRLGLSELVQIDHTRADIFVVDEETRQPIGRPWLTLAMDVCSRMVTGFYVTMSAPSRLSTSLCLLHSVFDKSAWLRERGIAEPWPVAGLPDTLHVDNGADFRSRAFKRGCEDAELPSNGAPQESPGLAATSNASSERRWGDCICCPARPSAIRPN